MGDGDVVKPCGGKFRAITTGVLLPSSKSVGERSVSGLSEDEIVARSELPPIWLSVAEQMTPPASSGLQPLLLNDSFLRFTQATKAR